MIIHHPQLRVLNMTEITSHNFHNLLPLRGAQVRDSLAWARYLGRALERYGSHSDILIAQHHWPVWGSDKLKPYLERQRDLYKFVHDQTMRLINHGYTGPEIAEVLTLPNTLQKDWSAHGFYGSLKHNVKAIYQRYLGWYDANPANLTPCPRWRLRARLWTTWEEPMRCWPVRRQTLHKANTAGWHKSVRRSSMPNPTTLAPVNCARMPWSNSATKPNPPLGATPTCKARWRCAKAPPKMSRAGPASPDVIRALTLDMFFDYLAIRVNCARAEGKHWVMNWHFTDTEQRYVLTLEQHAYACGRQGKPSR